MQTILFLNARRRNFLVRSIQDYIRSSGYDCRLIVCESDPYDPVRTVSEHFFHIPFDGREPYFKSLENLIRTEKVNAIVAWNDRDYELIFALQQFLDETGVVVLGPSKACFDVVYNKKACSGFLLQNQVVVPSTFSEESAVFPLVLKPEKGSGSVDVYTIRDRQELDAYIRKIRHPFLQEFIDGTHYTVDMFNTAYRNPAAAIPRKRLKVHGSESLVGQICMHADIIDLCLRIGRILDVVGAFNIQLIERDGSYYVHDINLRVSGSCDLTIAAGAPLHAWLVDYAMGKRSSFDVRIKDKMIMSKYYEPCFF